MTGPQPKISVTTAWIAWLIGVLLIALPFALAPGTFPNIASPAFLGIPVFLVWSLIWLVYDYAWIIYIIKNYPTHLPTEEDVQRAVQGIKHQ